MELRLPTPDGRTSPGWWLQAMANAYAWSAPPRAKQCPRTAGPWCWCASARCISRAAPRPPSPPRMHVCIKRGDRYQPVDAARLDLGDHRVTLTLPGGSPLVITTPMVARATYDKARIAWVLVPSASGAQMLRDAEWKGWSVGRKSYMKAPPPARLAGFEVLGAQAPALRDWIVHRLTGERPAGTPSLTSVFGLIGRDLCAAQESARIPEPDADSAPGGPQQSLTRGDDYLSPSQN